MSKKKPRPPAPARSSRSPSPSARKAKRQSDRAPGKRRLRRGATLLEVFTEEDRYQLARETAAQKAARRLQRETDARLAHLNRQAARYTRRTRTLLVRLATYGQAAPIAFLQEWRGSPEIVVTAGHIARFAVNHGGDLPPLALPSSALPPVF